MKQAFLLMLLGAAVVPTGCTLAPKYVRPSAPVAEAWPEGTVGAGAAAVTNAPVAADLGWEAFLADEKLRQVVGLALTNNLDLRAAALNVELARALYGIQRAALWPALDAAAGASKSRTPADLSESGHHRISERYDVNLGVASWEVDLFGRIRSLKDRALQEYLASEEARRGARLALISSVAETYLILAADRECLRLAETTLEAQSASYALIKKRYEVGVVTELDLFRAQTQVDSARGDVAQYTQRVAQDRNALDLLAGAPVPEALLPADLVEVAAPGDVRADLPSEALLRRPDVARAENLLKAANADIGAARAAFFPRISLTAAYGAASAELDGLFKGGSRAWSFSPQVVAPVFDARTWQAFKGAKAQQKIAVNEYERAVQSAFREVADALAVRGTVGERVAAQESLVGAVEATYRLSRSRYDKGVDSYLSVLDAQRSLYSAQQGLVGLRLVRLANLVRLYAVLGGGAGDPAPAKVE
mgnify:CR=1 FL=1